MSSIGNEVLVGGVYVSASMRNRIINGGFLINQRGYVSGAATTAGQYTVDRWKVTGTAGITFGTTANKTTITIPSGQVLQQVIEGLNLQTGTYVLSWEGTAQGKIGAGAYGASGVTGAITGGANTTIEFGPGTVANVQLEIGMVAAPFEQRPYGMELALCQRYYQFLSRGLVGGCESTTQIALGGNCVVPMRASPTPALMQTTPQFVVAGAIKSGTALAIDDSNINADSYHLRINGFSGLTAGHAAVARNGSGGGLLSLTAEL